LLFDPALDRKWREWNDRRIERQVLARVEEQYAPIKQSFEQAQKTRETAAKWQQYEATVEKRAKENAARWDAMPFMDKTPDGKATPIREAILKRAHEVAEELKQQLGSGAPIDPMELPWIALQHAYGEVVSKQAIPSLQAKTQSQLIQTAVKKSQGSTVDPVASAPAQPRKARSVEEALDQAFSGVGV
jgi:hypothetical protein